MMTFVEFERTVVSLAESVGLVDYSVGVRKLVIQGEQRYTWEAWIHHGTEKLAQGSTPESCLDEVRLQLGLVADVVVDPIMEAPGSFTEEVNTERTSFVVDEPESVRDTLVPFTVVPPSVGVLSEQVIDLPMLAQSPKGVPGNAEVHLESLQPYLVNSAPVARKRSYGAFLGLVRGLTSDCS